MTAYKTAPALADGWEKVSAQLQNVLITHSWVDPVHVYVGTAVPAADSAYHECRAGMPFSMAGVSGQDVYIRSSVERPLLVAVTAA